MCEKHTLFDDRWSARRRQDPLLDCNVSERTRLEIKTVSRVGTYTTTDIVTRVSHCFFIFRYRERARVYI